MNPYWAAALVETIRAFMSLVGLVINKIFKKRPIYLTCCAILWFGTTSLGTYFYLNRNDKLILNYPWMAWLPVISAIFIYTARAIGIGSINHSLQVKFKIYITISPNTFFSSSVRIFTLQLCTSRVRLISHDPQSKEHRSAKLASY